MDEPARLAGLARCTVALGDPLVALDHPLGRWLIHALEQIIHWKMRQPGVEPGAQAWEACVLPPRDWRSAA